MADASSMKYLIKTKINVDGTIQRKDVVGAIFGQTEGLLGDELNLRVLQRSGRLGHVDVELEPTALFVMVMALMFSSSIMYFFENQAQPEKFSSIPMAMWWGMATLTTVGYGDISGTNTIERLICIFLMLTGVFFFTFASGTLTNIISESEDERKYYQEKEILLNKIF